MLHLLSMNSKSNENKVSMGLVWAIKIKIIHVEYDTYRDKLKIYERSALWIINKCY